MSFCVATKLLESNGVAKIVEEAGASAITVHPRTRAQGYEGLADWSIIKKVKELKVQLDIFDKKDYKEEEKLRKLSKKLKAEFGDTIITDFENVAVGSDVVTDSSNRHGFYIYRGDWRI